MIVGIDVAKASFDVAWEAEGRARHRQFEYTDSRIICGIAHNDSRPRRASSRLADAQCRPQTIGSHARSVYEWGAGPTVLLVHGWSGRTAQFGEFPVIA